MFPAYHVSVESKNEPMTSAQGLVIERVKPLMSLIDVALILSVANRSLLPYLSTINESDEIQNR